MKINGTYTFAAAPDTLWQLLSQPTAVAPLIPGCQTLTPTKKDGAYLGTQTVRSGPLQGSYTLDINAVPTQPGQTANLNVTAKAANQTLTATAVITLENQDGMTLLHYDVTGEADGDLTDTSPALIETALRALIRQTMENLGQQTQQHMLAGVSDILSANTEPAGPYTPQSTQGQEKVIAFTPPALIAAVSALSFLILIIVLLRRRGD